MATWHAFLIEGHNFRSEQTDGAVRPGRVGFYTWRFIEADDEETARDLAEDDVRSAAHRRFPNSPRGRVSVRTMGLREAPDLTESAPGMRGCGFILFPETPVVSEIASAFDGLASYFKPAIPDAAEPVHGQG
ncbi:hypothetical protein ACKTEK_10175 [Tepidamorphus sp. 3E244]|uniref:hypothetical protein n=1 Tax=Tepidamorphus sp. 3E244 TaxID=3385498 RepID=UPI0038FD36A9